MATVPLNDAAIISHNEDGGVSIESGRLILNDSSSIRGNRSTYPGGGVWLSAGALILNDQSSISGNSAGGLGGGVASFRARVTLTGSSSIHHNAVVGTDLYPTTHGGGLFYSPKRPPTGATCGLGGNVHDNTPDDCYAGSILDHG